MTAVHHKEIDANDPTRSGPPMPTGNAPRLSQNEIEQLCLKAARGAGMSWGLAEEAGFAAGWLAMRGLDGPGALLAQLRDAANRPWQEICPVLAPGAFRATSGGRMCPIALGAILCDHARLPETAMDAAALHLGPVNRPLLLLPFLSELGRARDHGLRLDWPQGTVLLTADGRVSGDLAALAAETGLEAELSANRATAEDPPLRSTPYLVPPQTLADLNDFALRTTVPASDASRAGAGAAASDND